VLNDGYAKTYLGLTAKAPKKTDLKRAKEMQKFAKEQKLSKKERNLFKTRYQLDKKLGANEHYLGNGTTKNMAASPDGPKLGVVETFTYDKNPQTLGVLEKQGTVKRISLGK
jgi:ribosomal protein L9